MKAKKITPSKAKSKVRFLKKIDEKLLNLPHSSLQKFSDSLSKISNDMAGIAGVVGRAVLERAKNIRESLASAEIKPSAPVKRKKVSVVKVATKRKSPRKVKSK